MATSTVASYIFGALTIVFLMVVFFLKGPIDRDRRRVLAFLTAISGGLFAFFFSGELNLVADATLPSLAKLVIRATGGIALFVFILFWWWEDFRSPRDRQRFRKERIREGGPSCKSFAVTGHHGRRLSATPGESTPFQIDLAPYSFRISQTWTSNPR